MNQEEMIKILVETEARSKSNKHRLDRVEERQDKLEKLTAAVSVVQANQENIEKDVGEIKDDVKALLEKPAKRWDGAVEKLITVLIGIAVGFFINGGMAL